MHTDSFDRYGVIRGYKAWPTNGIERRRFGLWCYDCNNHDLYESAGQKYISAVTPEQTQINSNTKTINKTEHCCLLERKYDGGGK